MLDALVRPTYSASKHDDMSVQNDVLALNITLNLSDFLGDAAKIMEQQKANFDEHGDNSGYILDENSKHCFLAICWL